MRVRAIRAFWFDAKLHVPGSVVDLPAQMGREVIYRGSAEPVGDEPIQIPSPMTTDSAGGLVPGKPRKGK
jgi:hypothetical protein